LQGLADQGPSPSGQARANETQEIVEKALARLSDDERRVILLRL
jgi:DNA-directed RNA polymerase specialized sigma24 family protein